MLEPDRIGEALTLLLHDRQLSQAELSRRSGVHRSKISEYMSGKSVPRLDTLARMLGALNSSLLEFAQVEDDGLPPADHADINGSSQRIDLLIELYQQLIERVEHVEWVVRTRHTGNKSPLSKDIDSLKKELNRVTKKTS